MKKLRVAILGTGNIGMDLLMKVRHNELLTCAVFAGHNPDSDNIDKAQEMGVPTTFRSIAYLQENPDAFDAVFDATSARVHRYHAPILRDMGKFTIDLTPAHVGPFCVPVLNVDDLLDAPNVNMITCGGQAIIPIAYAIKQAQPDARYFEMVATISSKSAGPGTRANIDEFTQTTADALRQFTGVDSAKAIIVLNPAVPPITMHNTLYALLDNPDMDKVTDSIRDMIERIRQYVPGYVMTLPPVYENGRLTVSVSVEGSGDFLPNYAGNLDVISCAAIRVAEQYALRKAQREAAQ